MKPTQSKSRASKKPNNPFCWVEIPVIDLERAKSFYGKVFGYKFEMLAMQGMKMAFFPSSTEGWGSGGSLMLSEMYKPSHDGPMVYFSVADIEATLKKVGRDGGTVFQHKKSIGPYGFVGYFEDSEGNRIGLHSLA